jgi:serpin B
MNCWRKAKRVELVTVAVAVMVSGCSERSGGPEVNTPQVNSVVRGNTVFTLDLYKQLQESRGNLFFSPYNVYGLLAMTCAGARGQTESEIRKALAFDKDTAQIHDPLHLMTDHLAHLNRPKRIVLEGGASLWCQKGYALTNSYVDLVRSSYNATVRNVDFLSNPQDACGQINDWVSKATHDRIKEIISAANLDPASRLVLCSALYFKGKWQDPFDPSRTTTQPFYVEKDRSVPVPMMYQAAEYRVAEKDTLVLLEMPYWGKTLSLVIILPKAVDGLDQLQSQLTADQLENWLTDLDHASATECFLSVPRFKFTTTLNLAQHLNGLGIKTAFDPANADLSGMNGKRDLSVSTVLHRTFIDVDEEGTEAAAASGVASSTAAAAPTREVKVDHPILFLIRENRAGMVLFFGRVADPSK